MSDALATSDGMAINAVNLFTVVHLVDLDMSKKICNFKKDIHEPSSSHILIILGHRQNLKTQATKFLSNTNTFQPNLYHVRLQCKYYIIFLQLHLVRQHLGWHIIDKHLQIEPKQHQ